MSASSPKSEQSDTSTPAEDAAASEAEVVAAKATADAAGKKAGSKKPETDSEPLTVPTADLIAEANAWLGVPNYVAAGALLDAPEELNPEAAKALVAEFLNRPLNQE